MHFFPLIGQPLISDLEKKKIQMLKEFALLKGEWKHFEWLVQTIILKLPCEQIKHLTVKQCSMLSFVTRDFSPQAICSLTWQLTRAVACFWIPFQRSQSEPTEVCEEGWIFLKARGYLPPSIFFYNTLSVCVIIQWKKDWGE